MLPGRRDQLGRLYINAAAPPPPPQSPIQSGGVLWTLNGAATVVDGAVVLNGVAGTNVSTPDSAAADITGDVDIRVRLSATDWTPSVQLPVVTKWTVTGNQRGYALMLNTAGTLALYHSADGIAAVAPTSSNALNFVDGSTHWLRGTRSASTGQVNYYISEDGLSWTPVGGGAGTPSAIFNSSANVLIGALDAGVGTPFAGKIYQTEIRNGIDGPVAVSFNAADAKFNAGAYMGGIQLSSTGQVYVTASPAVTDTYDNGFRVSALGQLVITPGGIVASFQEGLPRDSNSAVVTLANGTPVPIPGAVFGPELVVNGDFSNGTTGWVTNGATIISAVAGRMVITANGTAYPNALQNISGLIVGKSYRITAVGKRDNCVANIFAGVVAGVQIYGSNTVDAPISINFVASAVSMQCNFGIYSTTELAGNTASFDSFSIKEVDLNAYNMLGGLSIANTGLYTTDASPVVGDPPENTVRPDMTGTNTLGSTLTCSTGTWTNSPTGYAYQWFQNNTPLIGQTLNTHVITAGDISSTLICRVTATNADGGNQAFSNAIIAGGARYNYTTSTDQLPTPGNIVNATGSLIIRMNRIDMDGIDRYGGLSQLQAGDTVTIGVTSGVLANAVNFNGDVAQLYMVSWTGPANGTYVVTVTLA